MTKPKEKPPTQGVGVQGFNAFITPADEPRQKWQQIDWQKLKDLPPFDMFLDEVYGGRDNVLNRLIDQEETLYNEYCDWHASKGYWKNETPMGEVIDGN